MATAPETRRIALTGHALRCRLSGSGEPLFLCLHGLVDRIETWEPLVGPLGELGRVVCIDQRGHGESGAPPGSYRREDLAADVVGVLDAIGARQAILVGHSMGGVVSMATALAHPDRVSGLVMIGTASHCSERVAAWYERIAAAGESDGLQGLARAIQGEGSKRAIAGDAQGIAHVTRMLKSLYSDPLTDRLAAVTCPVLLLVGADDPMGPKASEIIRDALPDGLAHLERIPDRGHWVHVEDPKTVARAIARWRAARG